jgi:hypothetical protein
MTATVVTVMLVALYLAFRIALSMQPPEVKKDGGSPQKRRTDISVPVMKSSFVRPESGQPKPTPADTLKTDFQEEKHAIFVPENGKEDAVVPLEKLDEVFDEVHAPDAPEIEPEENENGNSETDVDLAEEAEDLHRMPDGDANPAKGFSFEDMEEAAEAVAEPTDEKGEILCRVEKTDMFERLVFGDREKAERIKAIIDRHVRSCLPQVESDSENNGEWRDFDIRNFTGKSVKK